MPFGLEFHCGWQSSTNSVHREGVKIAFYAVDLDNEQERPGRKEKVVQS